MTRFLFMNAIAGNAVDVDVDAIRACELMGPRLVGRGDTLDIYAFRLVEPLLQLADMFKARLGAGAKTSVNTTIAKAKKAITEHRSFRSLDSEEERVWRQLRSR